jgi:hypothetical protein
MAVLLLLAVVGAALWRAPITRPTAPGADGAGAVGPVAEPARLAAAGTAQRFDVPGVGTPFAIGVDLGAPGRAPELIAGGPTGAGQAMRLGFDGAVPTHNMIAFDRTDVGAADQIAVDFDFRVVPTSGSAAGLGVALLSTAAFGASGAVDLQPPLFAAEEPDFTGSIGVGFDVHRSGDPPTEVSHNRVSVYFDGRLIHEVDLGTALDLASGEWTHARIMVRPSGFSDVTVRLAGCGRAPITVVDRLGIGGLAPYESRLQLAARAGRESANHDIDNVRVQLLDAAQSIPDDISTCRSVVANDFDGGFGTPYATGAHAAPPTSAAQVTAGGPTGVGNMLRLAFGRATADDRPVTTASHNSVTFDRADAAATDQIVADFDLRIRPGVGRGDGLGFALLDTAIYGDSGPVAPAAVAEEPNLVGSLGIGFDVYRPTDATSTAPTEISANHVSVHFDGAPVREFDVTPALDLAGGEWVHVRVLLRPGGDFSDVTVTLTQCGRPASTVVDRLPVGGFVPYRSRPHFAARAVDGQADHDIDNVRVTYLGLDQSVVSFDAVCHRAVETAGGQVVSVSRAGATTEPTSVRYSTADGTAAAGSDYVAAAGVLEFAAGETTKSISLALVDDGVDEGDETFLVGLDDADASVVAGPATTSVKIVDDERARRVGSWGAAIPSQVVPIQMSLLPTGDVMYWDRHDHSLSWDGQPRLWDPRADVVANAAALTYDLFCSGYALLADGRLLVVGGHVADLDGEKKASIYDPVSGTWTRLPDMNAGRWYPTALTLASGDVLVMGGTYVPVGRTQHEINLVPQVWQAASNTWRDLSTAQQGWVPQWADFYPFLYVAPNGRVFDAGPLRAGPLPRHDRHRKLVVRRQQSPVVPRLRVVRDVRARQGADRRRQPEGRAGPAGRSARGQRRGDRSERGRAGLALRRADARWAAFSQPDPPAGRACPGDERQQRGRLRQSGRRRLRRRDLGSGDREVDRGGWRQPLPRLPLECPAAAGRTGAGRRRWASRLDGRPAAELLDLLPALPLPGRSPAGRRRSFAGGLRPRVHRRDAGRRVDRGRHVDPALDRDALFQLGPAHQPPGLLQDRGWSSGHGASPRQPGAARRLHAVPPRQRRGALRRPLHPSRASGASVVSGARLPGGARTSRPGARASQAQSRAGSTSVAPSR